MHVIFINNWDKYWYNIPEATGSGAVEQFSKSFQLDVIIPIINFLFKLGNIMTRYDFLEARWVILNCFRTNSNLAWFFLWIMANKADMTSQWMILINVWMDLNLTQFYFWSIIIPIRPRASSTSSRCLSYQFFLLWITFPAARYTMYYA